MLGAVKSAYSALPRSQYFYLLLAASPLLAIIVPLGVLLSQPLYASSLDVALVLLLVSLRSASLPSSLLPFGLLLFLPSLLRLLALRYVHGLTTAQTLTQKNALFLFALLTVVANVLVYAIPSSRPSSASTYPAWLFGLSLVSSLVVLISIVWVPTSHQQAWEAETAVLKEAGLHPHAHRYKKAGIAYILLDHPLTAPHSEQQSRKEEEESKQADDSLSSIKPPRTARPPSTSPSPSDPLLSSSISPATSRPRPALFLLHGYGAGAAFWAHSMAGWADHFDVYSLDLPGFGMSNHDPFTARTPQEAEAHYVEAIHRLQLALHLDEVMLMGHSLGGMVAAAYALRYPSLVSKVILVSPVGIPDPPPGDQYRGPAAARRYRHLFRWLWNLGLSPASALHFAGPFGSLAVDFVIQRRFSHLSHVQTTPSFARYLYHINAGKGSGLSTLNSLLQPGAYARWPLGKRMAEGMEVETHWVWGQHDWMYTEESVAVMQKMKARGVRGSRVTVSGAGHQVSMENLREFNAVILRLALGSEKKKAEQQGQ